MVTMGATLFVTAYWAASTTPSVAPDCAETKSIVAFLAIAPAHSTSRADSASSVQSGIPGLTPFTKIFCGSFAGSPALVRKVSTSESATSVRPTTAMLCPLPSSP